MGSGGPHCYKVVTGIKTRVYVSFADPLLNLYNKGDRPTLRIESTCEGPLNATSLASRGRSERASCQVGRQGRAARWLGAVSLDHFLLSPKMSDRFVDGGVDRWVRGEVNASDHAPV